MAQYGTAPTAIVKRKKGKGQKQKNILTTGKVRRQK
jgi:hypothetical protein